MDVLAHASMKDAAKCDTHCELQILVNHQISERIWRCRDFSAARLFQCLLISPISILTTIGRAQFMILCAFNVWLVSFARRSFYIIASCEDLFWSHHKYILLCMCADKQRLIWCYPFVHERDTVVYY